MKTRKTLLLNLSEQQVQALEMLPCILDALSPEDRRRLDQLVQRKLVKAFDPISPAGGQIASVTCYGSAALAAYRAAEAANLLRDVS